MILMMIARLGNIFTRYFQPSDVITIFFRIGFEKGRSLLSTFSTMLDLETTRYTLWSHCTGRVGTFFDPTKDSK